MKLTFQPGETEPMVYHIAKPSFVIGRSPSCDIPLTVEGISRQHCRIDYKDGSVYLTDLGSTNGVFIDGRRIPAKTPVLYQVFLPLSIGSIPIVTIELGDSSRTMGDWAGAVIKAGKLDDESLTRTKLVTRRRPAPAKQAKPHESESESNSGRVINIIALLILILGVVYFFNSSQSNDPEESAPATSNTSKNINDNGHF